MKSKLGIVSLWLLVFVLGGVAGAVSHYLYVRDQLKQAAIRRGPLKPGDIQKNLAQILNLDDQQKESLKITFAQSRTQLRTLYQKYKPQFEALKPYDEEFMRLRREFDEELKKTLRPDQRAKFEEFLKRVYAQPSGTRPAQPAR